MNWVYHKDHEAKLIEDHEYDDYLEDGWVDSPAKCLKEPSGIIEKSKEVKEVIEEKEEFNVLRESEVNEIRRRGRPPRIK